MEKKNGKRKRKKETVKWEEEGRGGSEEERGARYEEEEAAATLLRRRTQVTHALAPVTPFLRAAHRRLTPMNKAGDIPVLGGESREWVRERERESWCGRESLLGTGWREARS